MSDGILYVIGTPIGNIKDITLRALEVLNGIDVLVCEDSRVTSHLINHYLETGQLTRKPRYFVCNEFNEYAVSPQIVSMVADGSRVGLVSDAGMPTLSDPGYRAIRGCLDAGLPVDVIPGVSSLTTALAASGAGGEHVLYLGFLPKKQGKRTELLTRAKEILITMDSIRVVLFISPHKLQKELKEIESVMGGDTPAVLLRELTKKFEQRIEAPLSELVIAYEKTPPKGEMVLVLSSR